MGKYDINPQGFPSRFNKASSTSGEWLDFARRPFLLNHLW
jgi:hypothetical protein